MKKTARNHHRMDSLVRAYDVVKAREYEWNRKPA